MMTNYMELLMTNQPWNLLLFMVIPVGLAEFLVATEFYTLFQNSAEDSVWKKLNELLGRVTGIYFAGVFLYLATQVVPNIEWRGWADMLAVGAYLSGVIPLFGITLLEFGVIKNGASVRERTHTHFLLLIGFLIVSHVAMVFGMADPAVTGWQPQTQQEMHMHTPSHAAAPHDSHTVNEM